MKRIFITVILIFSVLIQNVSASVLGSVIKYSSKLPIGQGLTLYNNTFLSDQNGVGHQREYYTVYTPNTSAIPAVIGGDEIYGKRTATEAINYMRENDMIPLVGINASFFSFETGIPMGHTINNKRVTSKDDRTLPAVGFRDDGTGHIGDLSILTVANFGEDYVLQIPHINKYISKETQMLTLFTPDFGEYTGTSTKTLNVVLTNISDQIRIGNEITCSVLKIFESDEPVKINDDEFILSVNINGNQWAITLINTLVEGEEIKISTTANNDLWDNIDSALASEGERLINNGEVAKNLEAGAAPRTAVGIKENGDIIFYVLDGRRSGFSYGAKKETVAIRLKELGCVDAINLDGGGSTTMAGIYPGCDETAIINSPSGNILRPVTNFIFLKNMTRPNGEPYMAYIYPYQGRILSGSTVKLDVKTVDSNFYPIENSGAVFSCNEYGLVDDEGNLIALGEGNIEVFCDILGISTSTKFKSIITPDNVELYNKDNLSELQKISVMPGDTIRLTTKAYHDGEEIFSSNEAYRWTLSDDSFAKITQDGVLTISPDFYEKTTLKLKAGGYEREFEIVPPEILDISNAYPKSDISILDNKITINMYSEITKIDLENSYVKIDNTKIPIEELEVNNISENHIRLTYDVDDEFLNGHHKIFVKTTLVNEFSCVNSKEYIKNLYESIFSDTNNHWANNIISYMTNEKIVSGSEEADGIYFRPNDSVTRAEFAKMVCNLLGIKPSEYSDKSLEVFADFENIPVWAEDYIKAVYYNNIITGKEDGELLYYEPQSQLTRAEAATVITRILPQKLYKKSLEFTDKDTIPSWANVGFKTLYASGLIEGYDDNTIRPNGKITRAEAVTMLYNIY